MPTRSLKARTLLLCLGLFLAGAVVVWAGGQAEPRLSEAQRLIQQKEYSAALKLIARIQRDNPELRDRTQAMISQIREVMNQYNAVLGQIGDARTRGDIETMERLLPRLSEIDPSRSGELVAATATLASFFRLMNAAGSLLSQGRPNEAIGVYLQPFTGAVADGGFALPVRELESAGYSAILTASAEQIVGDLAASARADLRAAAAIAGGPDAVEKLLAGTATASTLDAFDAAIAPLRGAESAEGAARRSAAAIGAIARTIRDTEGEGRADPYLQYVLWLSLGRENKNEGLLRAMHLLWSDTARATAANASTAASRAFAMARARMAAGALDDSLAGFDDAYYKSIIAVKASSLAAGAVSTSASAGWTMPPEDHRYALTLMAAVSVAQEQAAEVDGYRALIAARKAFNALPVLAAVPAASEQEGILAARKSIDALISDADARRGEWELRAAAWGDMVQRGYASPDAARSAQGVADQFARLAAQDLRERDIAYALRLDRIGALTFPARLADARSLTARGEDERDGTEGGKLPAATQGIAVRHPERAVVSFRSAAAGLDTLIDDIESHATRIRADKPWVTGSGAFDGLFSGSVGEPGLDELLSEAQAERIQCERLIADAQGLVDQAAVYSREGDNWFNQAITAVGKNDPDNALECIDKSEESYVKSLASAYTDHAAARTAREIGDLRGRVSNIRNAIAIQDAQKAIASITRMVKNRDYLGASVSLDAAETNWLATQEGSYPPFDNLRQNIQNALDLSQGRDISRVDPKADVVNAFIKNAQDNLAVGRLADAERNVKDALAVAPNYGAAKVLELMIKKQTDPSGFQKEAQEQMSQYVAMAADAGNPAGQKTAYLALLDYSRLDPRFATRLKGTIQELEYTLGLARRPPSPQQIRQSDALVAQAATIQQAGTMEAWQEALRLLKQALQVNPDNAAAVRLDGQIRTRIGSTALTALSPGENQRYNEALNLYLSGAYQDSYGIVLDLWNDARSPRNKTYGPLQKLKKRLEVALNIS